MNIKYETELLYFCSSDTTCKLPQARPIFSKFFGGITNDVLLTPKLEEFKIFQVPFLFQKFKRRNTMVSSMLKEIEEYLHPSRIYDNLDCRI